MVADCRKIADVDAARAVQRGFFAEPAMREPGHFRDTV
jgi:hypothetical protein